MKQTNTSLPRYRRQISGFDLAAVVLLILCFGCSGLMHDSFIDIGSFCVAGMLLIFSVLRDRLTLLIFSLIVLLYNLLLIWSNWREMLGMLCGR